VARVLHISDLHVSAAHGAGRTLETVWQPVAASLRAEKFDFVVVSGDLTDAASEDEYGRLCEFAENTLLARLVRPERSRIIFVPGNHDVRWDDSQFEQVRFDQHEPEELPSLIQSTRFAPELSDHRMHVTKFGHVELLRIKREAHERRMANVQAFFELFYKDTLRDDSQRFSLDTAAGHWSCHSFVEDGLAFIGLNSCHSNDKYWHGAGFHQPSLARARDKVETLKSQNPNLLVIAVWHHGFASSPGRPDRLSLADLGLVFNTGARLGLHGHTHEADAKHHPLLNGKLPVIATGSLSADKEKRPDGTPNQFCTLRIQQTRVHVTVHRLEARTSEYRADPEPRVFDIGLDADGKQPDHSLPSCERHRRTCKVNADGIAYVSVEIEGLKGAGSVPLTLVNRTFCGLSSHRYAKCDDSNVDVHEKVFPDQRRRYSIVLKRNCSLVKWEYYISNAVALNQNELLLLPERVEHPHLDEGYDAYSHTVRFPCEHLELSLRMEKDGPSDVRVFVERPTQDGEDTPWEPDHQETSRVKPRLEIGPSGHEPGAAVLTVDGPLVGHRYSLLYRPRGLEQPYPSKAAALALFVLDDCRNKRFDESELRSHLSAAIDGAIERALGGRIGEWSGHLWHARDRALLPAFGSFRSQAWATYFEAGTGVAGHAFRHSQIVAWDRDVGRHQAQTIFRKSLPLPGQKGPDYKWVLCIPIRLELSGPSIGVIGLAREAGSGTAAERECERFVAKLVEHKETDEKLQQLEAKLHIAFWTTLANAEKLPNDLSKYAQTRRDTLVSKSPTG
jgi:3',5'-cyclic AMP phosphodiesterase CpdA